MNKLSVCLAIYNEEIYLSRCLNAIKSIADEIVIVDGGSTDDSVAIAKNYKAIIIQTDNPPIFHINKQKALEACRNQWILQLDADEVVSDVLSKEILQVIQMTDKQRKNRNIEYHKKLLFQRHQGIMEGKNNLGKHQDDSIVAFYIPRKNYFLGHPLTYAGMYPDGVIRLVKNGKAVFPCKSVHEQIQVFGETAWLAEDLLHFSNDTLARYQSGATKYTNLLANQMKVQLVNFSFFDLFYYISYKPLIVFCSLYIRHKDMLDGFYGFIFCLFSAFHYPIAYIKYLFLKRSKNAYCG